MADDGAKDLMYDASEFLKLASRRGDSEGALLIYRNIAAMGMQEGLRTMAGIVALLAVRLGRELDGETPKVPSDR